MMELTREQEELLNNVIEEVHKEIPENPSVEVDTDTLRFSAASWFEKIQEVTVLLAGCGGIGSYVAYFLSRVKPYKIILFDPDNMEGVNMAGQLFSTQDLGKAKVLATANRLENYSNYYNVDTYITRYVESSGTQDIMICGFDNMIARKVFYNNWKKRVLEVKNTNPNHLSEMLFIDGKLAAEEFQILAITGDDEVSMAKYEEEYLFSDSEADETLCSFKQTAFAAGLIGGYMVNIFINHVANTALGVQARSVPFLTAYNANTLKLDVQ
mgnify:FL=1